MNNIRLAKQIVIALILGVVVGGGLHHYLANPEMTKEVASYFNMITDVFLRLIKMIIAPLVFATLVAGLASMSSSGSGMVARISIRSMTWFVCASLFSLSLGIVLVNVFQPGAGMNLPIPEKDAAVAGLNTSGFTLQSFLTHVFPRSIAEAMATNEILQILIFALFFGAALAYVKKTTGNSMIQPLLDELVKVMFRITDYVMALAPIAVFTAIGSAITVQGLGLLVDYGKLVGEFYVGIALLWAALILVGRAFLGNAVFKLIKLIREPVLLAFSTCSSESAYPKTIDALENFGASKNVTRFVLPLGYSFNLDGSMMYQAFALMFIAQAYNIDLSIFEQVVILLTCMITSKGMAGVARASLVVVAATLPIVHLPEAGLLLIIGIDPFMDMARTATNVGGNSIATAVVAKLEADRGEAPAADTLETPAVAGTSPRQPLNTSELA